MVARRRNRHHRRHRPALQKLLPRLLLAAVAIVVLLLALMMAMPSTFSYLRQQVRQTLGVDQPAISTTGCHGIDISHHQGHIDWDEVAKDTSLQFVYIKATEGATHLDSRYERNFHEAKAKGLKVGSYHYLNSKSSVRKQAQNFILHCDKADQDLLPMVDVEGDGVKGWTPRQVRDSLWVYAELIRHHYGQYPILYSYAKFYNTVLAPHFNRFYLFIAKYSPEEPVVKGAGKHNIWQITDQGTVRGIEGKVDLDVFAEGTAINDIILNKQENAE